MHSFSMGYWGKCFRRAFAGSVLLTDKISIIAGVFTPALFFVVGKPIDSTYQAYIAWSIILIVGGGIVLRFISAPYFIWREDQQRIGELESLISDSGRRRREFFENTFLSDRALLAKKLNQYALALPTPEAAAKFDPDMHLFALTGDAAFFLGDQNFKLYWNTFCQAFRNMTRGATYLEGNSESLSPEHRKKVIDRFQYDLSAAKSAAGAMVFILTENENHGSFFERSLNAINETYAHVILDDLEISLWSPNFEHSQSE